MQQKDPDNFRNRLNTLISKTPAEMKASFEKTFANISNLGIDSFESLSTALQNRQMDEEIRGNLAWLAGQLRNKSFAKVLLSLFEEDSERLLWQAAHSLTMISSKRAISPLLVILKQNESADKRKAAAYALQALPDDRATKALIETLQDKNEQAPVRGQAAESLTYVEFGQPDVISSLLSGLEDEEAEVRFWCVFALGQLGSVEVISSLEKLTGDEKIVPGWWSVGKEAQDAIEHIKLRNKVEV